MRLPDLSRPVEQVAPLLLGCRLRTVFGAPTEVVITEVEAYGAADDMASHAHGGRTERNGSMFADAGTLYVYRSYGIHWCANVVTGSAGEAAAILLRAGEPTEGALAMCIRRGRSDHLTDGPGKLTQALGISGDHDGTSAISGPVKLVAGSSSGTVIAGPRVGLNRATEANWRFVLVRG